MALLDMDMPLAASVASVVGWLAFVLRRQLRAQRAVLVYRRVAWCRASCSLDAVRSRVEQD
jgi:hypothetical protein